MEAGCATFNFDRDFILGKIEGSGEGSEVVRGIMGNTEGFQRAQITKYVDAVGGGVGSGGRRGFQSLCNRRHV